MESAYKLGAIIYLIFSIVLASKECVMLALIMFACSEIAGLREDIKRKV